MSSWAMVAIVAIVVWGIVQLKKARYRSEHSIVTDERGNERQVREDRDPATDREIEDLRDRIAVLERIATDGNSFDARETRRIAEEFEQLRDKSAD